MGIEEIAEDAVPALKGVKVALIGGLIAVFALLGLGTYLFYKQHIKDQQTIATQKEVTHEVKQNLVVADTGAKANDVGQTVAAKQKEEHQTSTVEIRNKLQQSETKIRQTVKDPQVQAEQFSEVRMQSVWDTYCQVEPSNAQCQPQTAAQGAAASSEAQVEGPAK